MSPRPEVPKQTDVTMRSVRPSWILSMAPSVNCELPNLFGAASVKRQRGAGKGGASRNKRIAEHPKTVRVQSIATQRSLRMYSKEGDQYAHRQDFRRCCGVSDLHRTSLRYRVERYDDILDAARGPVEEDRGFLRHRKLASGDREMRAERRGQRAPPLGQGWRHGR